VKVPIDALAAPDVGIHRAQLVSLLVDAVDGGASIGFLPPLGEAEAGAYWDTVATALHEGSRLLLAARAPEGPHAGTIVGSVQLDLATRANARHRAEVVRLMVHRRARRQGLGRALMLAIEDHARRLGRTTLVLDTRLGDPSENLYRSLGWTLAGTIPRYAQSAGGTLDATAIYYRLLDPQ
jgi:ribosomal protein S18 acetylase RimI-like enzyme